MATLVSTKVSAISLSQRSRSRSKSARCSTTLASRQFFSTSRPRLTMTCNDQVGEGDTVVLDRLWKNAAGPVIQEFRQALTYAALSRPCSSAFRRAISQRHTIAAVHGCRPMLSARAVNAALTKTVPPCAPQTRRPERGAHGETAEEQGGAAGRAGDANGGLRRAGATNRTGAEQRAKERAGAASLVAKTTGPEENCGELTLRCWTLAAGKAVKAP